VNAVYRGLSHTRVDYYAIAATFVNMQGWITVQIFSDLTLFLLWSVRNERPHKKATIALLRNWLCTFPHRFAVGKSGGFRSIV